MPLGMPCACEAEVDMGLPLPLEGLRVLLEARLGGKMLSQGLAESVGLLTDLVKDA